MTSADFGVQLVEPLQRFIALVDMVDKPDAMSTVQRQRQELAYQAVSKLNAKQFDHFLEVTQNLLAVFSADLENLQSGLAKQAEEAIRKLHQKKYRTWLAPHDHLVVEVKIDPRGDANNQVINPLGLTPGMLLPRVTPPPSRVGETSSDILLGVKPLTNFQTAVSIAFKSYKIYGAFNTLPGEDFSDWLKSTPDGQAMVGLSIRFATLNHMAFSSFGEVHFTEVGGMTTYYPVGGFGINW